MSRIESLGFRSTSSYRTMDRHHRRSLVRSLKSCSKITPFLSPSITMASGGRDALLRFGTMWVSVIILTVIDWFCSRLLISRRLETFGWKSLRKWGTLLLEEVLMSPVFLVRRIPNIPIEAPSHLYQAVLLLNVAFRDLLSRLPRKFSISIRHWILMYFVLFAQWNYVSCWPYIPTHPKLTCCRSSESQVRQ